jgi:hypothetical protein
MTLLNRNLLTLIFMLILAGSAFAGDTKTNVSLEKDEFIPVDLDQVLAKTKSKSANDGRRFIFRKTIPVSLQVKLMRLPEKRKIEYLYTAMSVAGIDPLPEVSHRMFVASASGAVIPVYVEDEAAKTISQTLKVNQDISLYAYHIYNYAKGPAYLVVGFKKETGQ